MKYLYFLFGLGFLFGACEDVIELDLEDSEPRIVIEAFIDASKSEAQVKISETSNFYEQAATIYNEAEIVRLRRSDGDWIELFPNEEGVYVHSELQTETGEVFELEVSYNNNLYRASARVPQYAQLQQIDSSAVSVPVGDQAKRYRIIARWNDNTISEDFYRIRAYIDGEHLANVLSLYDDRESDGGVMIRPIQNPFLEGELVNVELMSMDPASYEYFRLLSTLGGQGNNSSIPFNPKGNFSGDALGYFGIYTSSTLEIQL